MEAQGISTSLPVPVASVTPAVSEGCMNFTKYYLYVIAAIIIVIAAYMWGKNSCKNESKSKSESKPKSESKTASKKTASKKSKK